MSIRIGRFVSLGISKFKTDSSYVKMLACGGRETIAIFLTR